MRNKGNPHVVKRDDGWTIRREGAGRDSSKHDSQSDAINRSREIAKNIGGEVVIHDRDGKIRDKDSYGHDPHPPKDQKH